MSKRASESHREFRSKKSRRNSQDSKENSHTHWPEPDLKELRKRIQEVLPTDDQWSYRRRFETLDWQKVAFKKYTAKECKKMWTSLSKPVRKHRLFSEVMADVETWMKSNKPKQKHPDLPKQPFNSYMLFLRDHRRKFEQKHRDLLPNEVTKVLGQIFRELPDEERSKYDEMAQNAKLEHQEKLEQFYQEHPEEMPTSRKKDVVKKPRTPFEIFSAVEQEQQEVEVENKLLFQQTCRQRWNEMADQDKVFWINWAEEEVEKYEEEVKAHMKSHPGYQPDVLRVIITKKERALKERIAGKPEKPPHSALHLFTKLIAQNEEVRRIDSKNIFHYIGEKWRESSAEEKEQYRAKLDLMWEHYHRDMELYLEKLPPGTRDMVRERECRKRDENREQPIPEQKKKVRVARKPEPPPLTDYKFFLANYRGRRNPAMVWRQMPPEERDVYTTSWKLMQENYIVLYEEYLKSLPPEELRNLNTRRGFREYDTSTDISSSGSDGEE